MTRLKSISVTDFRSIRGSHSVPLDAPMVLIHGQNGTGKTSLLSAIELGLTGEVPSLARVDPEYVRHMVHKEAKESRIQLNVDGLSPSRAIADLRVSRTEIVGAPLLGGTMSRFYSERCFLAQATLGRLLELYEDKDARKSDSRLTKFVKDLLGLDHLDALIDGLHDAGDVRRLRTTVPAFWEAKESIPALSRDLERLLLDLDAIADAESTAMATVAEALGLLEIEPGELTDFTALRKRLDGMSEEGDLQRLAGLRRSLGAVEQQWTAMADSTVHARREAEVRAADAASAFEAWEIRDGQRLGQTIGMATALFPDRQLGAESGPAAQHEAVARSVEVERGRLTALLARSAADDAKFAGLDQEIERAQARIAILEQQIAEHTQNAGQLAKALSEILPHVHSNDCPVCARDFAEVSAVDLRSHLIDRVSELSGHASHLHALSSERAQTITALVEAQRQLETLSSQRLNSTVRDNAEARLEQLTELSQLLAELKEIAHTGQRLIEENVVANRDLVALQSRDFQGESIRETLGGLAQILATAGPGDNEGVVETVGRLAADIAARNVELERRLQARRNSISQLRELESMRGHRNSLSNDIRTLEGRIGDLTKKRENAEKQILDARELAKRARDTRTDIVRRVFNDSLNSIWRDLFVRLAPEEPFVPAFALPSNPAGAVEAVLETLYRSGGKGGNPRSMLSAGNLNTAALTLFLSLHLSVEPLLPWLVIDDPVQSMDEVHIAQFAALLRTLSKEHGRQVIVAVHEKQLFDYLALELAPAFQSDRLITIELSRGADGSTRMDCNPVIWHQDTAIAA